MLLPCSKFEFWSVIRDWLRQGGEEWTILGTIGVGAVNGRIGVPVSTMVGGGVDIGTRVVPTATFVAGGSVTDGTVGVGVGDPQPAIWVNPSRTGRKSKRTNRRVTASLREEYLRVTGHLNSWLSTFILCLVSFESRLERAGW